MRKQIDFKVGENIQGVLVRAEAEAMSGPICFDWNGTHLDFEEGASLEEMQRTYDLISGPGGTMVNWIPTSEREPKPGQRVVLWDTKHESLALSNWTTQHRTPRYPYWHEFTPIPNGA